MLLYSAFNDKVERKCHFPVPGWNCKTHRQALQVIPNTILLHKDNIMNLANILAAPARGREVTVEFNFVRTYTFL